MRTRPRGYLQEPKNLIHDYVQRDKEGKKLNPYAVEQDDQSLYNAIMKQFDGFDDFLQEVVEHTGEKKFTPENIRIQQKWDLNKVKEELDRMYQDCIPLSYKHNQQKNEVYRKVVRTLIHYFGSIEEGLKYYNYICINKRLEKVCCKCENNLLSPRQTSPLCEECRGEG